MGGSQNPDVTHKDKNLQKNLQVITEEPDVNYFKRTSQTLDIIINRKSSRFGVLTIRLSNYTKLARH